MAAMILLPIVVFLVITLAAAVQHWCEAVVKRDMYKRRWEESRSAADELRATSIADAKAHLDALECIEDVRAALAAYDGATKEGP